MANKIFNTRVKNKRDTEANWESKNPVLLDGEIIVVTTTSGDTRFKVGDGKKTYKQLPFQDQKTRDLIPSVDSSLSSTSTNPVQNKIIKSELDKKADKTALDNKFDKAGGTLTGNLTGKYIAGTWLQTTEATDFGKKPGKIAILDDSGWIYYRTPSELLSDIGGVAINNFIDTIYPLGSIYITTSNTAPMSLFPGTYWLPIYDRFLLGGGSGYKVGSTGGEATHTLTVDEMPNHKHSISYPNAAGPEEAAIGYPADSDTNKSWGAEMCKTQSAGNSVAHNNMPPYLAVYIWKRVTFDEYEAGADGG